MALKLPDSAVPMGDFPVAKAVDIDFNDGENLQEKLDDGKLGGGEKIYTSTPIGTVLSFAGQTPPNGYLLCDGGSYAVADYQDLYDVIGNIYGGDSTNFNVPDYRETVLVGVGKNTTDTIADHDVYGLGEFKDDQMQRITGDFESSNRNSHPRTSGAFNVIASTKQWFALSSDETSSSKVDFDSSKVTRSGTTTHGKQKGVTYIIKAFHTNEGVDLSVELEDNVVNHINNRIENKVNEFKEQVDNQIENKVNEFTEQVSELVSEEISEQIKANNDVSKTTLTPVFPSGVVVDSGGMTINYIVRNGWCSVNFAFNVVSATTFSWTDIATGLPKPANSANIVLMNEGGRINRTISIKINSTGSVSSRVPTEITATDWWIGNISYPVAE